MDAGHNPKLFPDGPPIELLLACNTLADPNDAVDPLVAIGCDYLDRIKGRVSGTLDKMVSDHRRLPVCAEQYIRAPSTAGGCSAFRESNLVSV